MATVAPLDARTTRTSPRAPDVPIRAFTRPHRPLLVRAANRMGRFVDRNDQAPSFSPGALHDAARQKAGLRDFGSAEYEAPLEVLCRALEEEARLTPLGRRFARGQLVTALRNRLLIEHRLREVPEALDRPLQPVTLIVGLPRTGSTFLQHLLAEDPGHRPLLAWEAARPVPLPGADPADRIREVERGMRVLDFLAPSARALHPVAASAPTECVTLMANSLASLELATINWVPSYLDWCLGADMAPHYRYLRRQLQVLQVAGRRPAATRWVLKSPAHLFWLDDLLDAFDDCRVIVTHRQPSEVVPSFCSLSAVLCGVGSDDVPAADIGRRWSAAWCEGLDRAQGARLRHPEVRAADLRYPELVADPLAEVRRIYRELDLALSGEGEGRMAAHVAASRRREHTKHARGHHAYSLEQFGLTEDAEMSRFASYCRRYAL